MAITTSRCHQSGHSEFVLEADLSHVPQAYLDDVKSTIERMVANGSVLRPGQTFQIGWMLTLVQPHGASHLTLHEPDMRSMPVQWVPGITETLRHLMLQLYTLDSVSLRREMRFPSTQHSLLVCTRYTEPDFFMERFAPSEKNHSDTGWFLGCTNTEHDHNDPANLRCISVYEAFLRQKPLRNFAAFPVGSNIAFDKRNGLRISRNGKDLSIVPGSYLDQVMANRIR